MATIYSIRSKFFLAFLISAITVVGTCSVSIFFSERLLSSMNVFIDTTLPRLNRGNLLKTAAHNIGASVPALTTSANPDKMNAAYGEIEFELDQLETLTAEISRNGSRADILGLNWTSQAIRTHAQLLFQLTSQYIGIRESLLDLDQKCRKNLIRLWSFEADGLVSHRKEGFDREIVLVWISDMITFIDRLNMAEFMDDIVILRKEYALGRNRLQAPILPVSSGPEKDSGKIIVQIVSDMDTLFEMRNQEVLLRQSIKGFGAELDALVLKLSEITSDHMRYIFELFGSSAERVVEIEKKILTMTIALIVGAVLLLFGLYWRVAVRGFGDRLTTISRVMGRAPADNTDTKVPVGGRDEIATMARSLEGFLEKALRLRQLATIDELTKVYNRRRFFELAEKEVERAKRSHMPSAVIMMLDIDYFKSINDTFGHDIGDMVLYETAQTCMRAVRTIDLFARIGGEEFALLMPNTDLEAGLAVANRIQMSVEAQTVRDSNGNPVSTTISIGLTIADLSKETISEALKCSDAALYQAKKTGRNRVTVWETDAIQ